MISKEGRHQSLCYDGALHGGTCSKVESFASLSLLPSTRPDRRSLIFCLVGKIEAGGIVCSVPHPSVGDRGGPQIHFKSRIGWAAQETRPTRADGAGP